MSKAKISEEMLKKNEIPILDIYKLKFDYNNIIAISGFGKFYYGKYDNEKISLKIIDITIDETIINEFIQWKNYQNNPNFLKLKGVILYYNEAYIIYEDYFEETIQTLLEQQKLKYDEKIIIAKQLLNLLNSLQQEKKIITDLRPGTLIINSDKNIKLIDFGLIINMPKFIYEEDIKNDRIKYTPPEYIIDNNINQSYDIYSFGCILIDLFSRDLKDTIFDDKNKTYEEYLSDIKENKFPIIPNNINFLLYEIITKCLTKNPDKRIDINELSYNLNILLDYLENNNLKIYLNDDNINNKELKFNEEKEQKIYNFAKEINNETEVTINHINDNLQKKILNMKNDLFNQYENTLKQLDENYTLIKKKLDDIINTNKELIESFYQKIINNIYQMQNLISTGMNDLLDIQKQVDGIQIDLYIFNKFINQNNYKNIGKYMEQSKKEVEKIIRKYTNIKHYDLIDISCNSCSNLVNNYISLTNDFILSIKNNILENINNIKGLNNNDNKKIEELGDELFIQKIINNVIIPINDEIKNEPKEKEIKENEIKNEDEEENEEEEENENEEENYEKIINSMTQNIYAKIVENSNMVTIFNYYTKKIKNYVISLDEGNENNLKNNKFNSKCFSLYDKEKNCIYISGGLIDINNQNSHDNSFYKININLNIYNKDKNKKDNNNIFDDINNIIKLNKNKDKIADYNFIIEALSPMNNNRSYHSMLQLSSNKNILLCIGGINTETCEVYNIELDSWESLQDLPIVCQNPGIIDNNSCVYVFPYTKEFNNIYKLNMNNEDLIWENIKFSIDEGKIRKGMAIISIRDNIYLFGGYDNDNIYSNIYQVYLSDDNQIEIKINNELLLPKKCFFNSNFIIINNEFDNKNDENNNYNNDNNNENNNNTILIMDNNNEVIEFNNALGKFDYYLKE